MSLAHPIAVRPPEEIDIDDESEADLHALRHDNADESMLLSTYSVHLVNVALDEKSCRRVCEETQIMFAETSVVISQGISATIKYSEIKSIQIVSECGLVLLFVQYWCDATFSTRSNSLNGFHGQIKESTEFLHSLPIICRSNSFLKERLQRVVLSSRTFSVLLANLQQKWQDGDKLEHGNILQMDDGKLLFSYKTDPQDCVRITAQEYKSLTELQFVLDNVINFMMIYLRKKIAPRSAHSVKIFNTFFYSRNLADRRRQSETMNRWSKMVSADFFNRPIITIPVNIEQHWVLVCVLNPKRTIRGMYSGIVYFDSLELYGGNPKVIIPNIMEFLKGVAAKHEHNTKIAYDLQTLVAKTPKQTNFYDCALYIIHIMGQIFEQFELDPSKVDESFLNNLHPPHDMRAKTQAIFRYHTRKWLCVEH